MLFFRENKNTQTDLIKLRAGLPVNIFRTLHRSILMLFAVVMISIVTLVHLSVSKIVAEQSRAQQRSYSPALQLVVEQLMRPLHISQTLAKSKELKNLMSNPVGNEAQILPVKSAVPNMIRKEKQSN